MATTIEEDMQIGHYVIDTMLGYSYHRVNIIGWL